MYNISPQMTLSGQDYVIVGLYIIVMFPVTILVNIDVLICLPYN